MNAKTKQLLTTYADEIAKIKAFNEQIDKLKASCTANPTEEEYFAEQPTYGKIESLTWERNGEVEWLTHEIEIAYWDVPFAKPRQQGIENFWNAAGL